MTNEFTAIFYTNDGKLKSGVALLAARIKEYGLDIEALAENEINKLLECLIIAARNNNSYQW